MVNIDDVMRFIEEANLLIAQGKYATARKVIRSCPYYGDFTDAMAPLYFAEINSLLADGNVETAASIINQINRPGMGLLVDLYRLSYLAQIQQTLGKLDDALTTIEHAKMIASEHEDKIDGTVVCDITARQGYIL